MRAKSVTGTGQNHSYLLSIVKAGILYWRAVLICLCNNMLVFALWACGDKLPVVYKPQKPQMKWYACAMHQLFGHGYVSAHALCSSSSLSRFLVSSDYSQTGYLLGFWCPLPLIHPYTSSTRYFFFFPMGNVMHLQYIFTWKHILILGEKC